MKLEPYLKEKRNELLWALMEQGYTDAQLLRMWQSVTSAMAMKRIRDQKPADYKPKWVKQQ